MSILENIKNSVGRYLLNGKLQKAPGARPMPTYEMLHEIGILYEADQAVNEDAVLKFANHLRSEGKKVFLLGYLNQKRLPANRRNLLNQEYFWKEKLNGFNLPVKEKIGRFVHERFDLLLNLYNSDCLPLQAISGYSPAKFRMGLSVPRGLAVNDYLLVSNKNDLFQAGMDMEFYLRSMHEINTHSL